MRAVLLRPARRRRVLRRRALDRWRRHCAQLGMVMLFLPAVIYGLDLSVPEARAQSAEQPIPGYVLRSWTTREGLPQNMISTLLQTRDGYLWVGTSNAGLVRFDGLDFTVFDITNTSSLPSNAISTLHESADGTLWIGTSAGLVAYRDGVFTIERTGDDPPASPIMAVASDAAGNTWVASTRHVARRDGDRWTTIYRRGDATVTTLMVDDRGMPWIGTTRGLLFAEEERVTAIAGFDDLPSRDVRTIFETAAGELWIGMTRGLARVDRAERAVRAEPSLLGNAPVRSLFEDREHTLWVGSGGQVLIRPRDGPATLHTVADASHGGTVSAILADREGHVWIGLDGGGGGLYRFGRQRVSVLSMSDGLPCDNIGPVAQGADGTLWVGTLCHDGRGIVALRGGRAIPYEGPAFVSSILAEPDGAVWVGTFGGELFRLGERPAAGSQRPPTGNEPAAAFVEYPVHTAEPRGEINVLHRDGRGALWVGTSDGLFRHEGGRWIRMGPAEGLSSHRIRSIAAGLGDTLWIGSDAGLHRYRNGRFTNYAADEWLARAPVRAIHVDADGAVWIGTYGGGLCRLKSDRIHCFGTQGGLLDTSVHKLLEDAGGYLWMTGDRGVRRVLRRELDEVAEGRRTDLSVVVLDEADGMRSAECNGMGQPAGSKMADGTLQIPTQRGLVRIDPLQIAAIELPPPAPRLEQTRINGTIYPPTPTVTAPAGSTDFEFRYSAPTFERPDELRFRYRLDGYDADWVEAGTRRVAHYANLAPGDYRLRVAARTSSGTWSPDAADLAVTLRPYVHQRRSVQVALALVVLVAGVAGVRWRMASMRARSRLLEETIAERTAEVARQRDEVAEARDRLGEAKQEVEQAHGRVLAVLDQLDLGILVVDASGVVRYVSRSARRLLAAEDEGEAALVGSRWDACLPLIEPDCVQVKARIESPSPAGARVPVQMVARGRRYWMEMDVREEPRPGKGRILYIYNVTEVSAVSTRGDRHEGPYDLVGRSTTMHVVYKQIRDVARVDATVLIEGETGSGKELVARAVHRGSRRADRPFVAVNSAGLTESLLASQLFGHRRGAFTGAVADQMGVFEAANGGTLFLDEIGDIPMSVQVSLLRVLQEREITRIGESRTRHLDIRFLAATHRDLNKEVQEGRFREDLLYRIRVATIRVPPLRDRLDDVPLLVEAFIAQTARQSGRGIPEVSREAMAVLMRHPWPGNVRQLRSVIEQALLGSTGRVLRVEDFPADVLSQVPGLLSNPTERERLQDALRRAGGNRSEAARLLGIGRATLYRKLAVHGINADA